MSETLFGMRSLMFILMLFRIGSRTLVVLAEDDEWAEVCEEDTKVFEYCPLLPRSSYWMYLAVKNLSFDVCEEDVEPDCVSEPHAAKKTVVVITTLKPKPKKTKPTVTTTAATTTPTTTAATTTTIPITRPSVAKKCEQIVGECDASTVWQTTKTTKPVTKKRIPSTTPSTTTTEAEPEAESICEDEYISDQCRIPSTWLTSKTTIVKKSKAESICEDERMSDQCRIPSTWLTSKTTIVKKPKAESICEDERMSDQCRIPSTWLTSKTTIVKKPKIPKTTTTTTTTPVSEPVDTDVREECEETRGRCDMSMSWLTSKSTVKGVRIVARVTSTTSTTTPTPFIITDEEDKPTVCDEQDEPSVNVEAGGQCDSSLKFLSSKGVIDRTSMRLEKLASTTRKSVPTVPVEEASTIRTTVMPEPVSSTEMEATTGTPTPVVVSFREKPNVVEIRDMFKNLPVPRAPQFDFGAVGVGERRHFSYVPVPLFLKPRKTLAEIWREELRFDAMVKRYRDNLLKSRVQEEVEERLRSLPLPRYRTSYGPGVRTGWDYLQPPPIM